MMLKALPKKKLSFFFEEKRIKRTRVDFDDNKRIHKRTNERKNKRTNERDQVDKHGQCIFREQEVFLTFGCKFKTKQNDENVWLQNMTAATSEQKKILSTKRSVWQQEEKKSKGFVFWNTKCERYAQ